MSVRPGVCDLLVSGVRVADGCGGEPALADVAVKAGRIVGVGDGEAWHAIDHIHAPGRVLAPGFIDVHAHDDRVAICDGSMLAKASQGVTTVVVGNCGLSLAPAALREDPVPPLNLLGAASDFAFPTFESYAERLERRPPALNVVALVGHSSLRLSQMANWRVAARGAELDAMQRMLDDSLRAGAMGFSTGLAYAIGGPADRREVEALVQVLGTHGGVYATHLRDEHKGVDRALAEAFDAAAAGGVRLVLSHHKCAGPDNWGRTGETLAMIEAASARQDVACDVYPYNASSTILETYMLDDRVDVLISWSAPYPELANRYLHDIAAGWGCSQAEATLRLQPGGGIYFCMDEADVRRVLSHPLAMVGSDGLPHDRHPHPRLWGTFPRVLGKYCREVGLISLGEAVRKMTRLPAERFGLVDRGRVEVGFTADLVMFDPVTVGDTASYDDPRRLAAGIEQVWVAGESVYNKGVSTGARPGRLLRGPG
ncbi:MAG: D-aminoacylase [Nannocystaceae bacterium]